MSAEAPRHHSVREPITPHKSESGIVTGFLRRFLGKPTPTSIQPPPGLENFTDRLRRRVVDVTSELDITRRQAELERINLTRQDAERLARENEAREKQERQFAEDRLQALEEIKKIAARLKIRDRLEQINAHVWEGKGQIRNITTPPKSAAERFLPNSKDGDFIDLEAGYELVYYYEVPIREQVGSSYDSHSWRCTTGRESTSLKVSIGYADPDGTSIIGLWPHVGKSGKYVCVSSEYQKSRYIKKESYPWYGPEYEAEFLPVVGLNPPDREEIEQELNQLLMGESTSRIRAEATPSELFLLGKDRLKKARSAPEWNKWQYVQAPYSGGG